MDYIKYILYDYVYVIIHKQKQIYLFLESVYLLELFCPSATYQHHEAL
jgi:hypothetical protein